METGIAALTIEGLAIAFYLVWRIIEGRRRAAAMVGDVRQAFEAIEEYLEEEQRKREAFERACAEPEVDDTVDDPSETKTHEPSPSR